MTLATVVPHASAFEITGLEKATLHHVANTMNDCLHSAKQNSFSNLKLEHLDSCWHTRSVHAQLKSPHATRHESRYHWVVDIPRPSLVCFIDYRTTGRRGAVYKATFDDMKIQCKDIFALSAKTIISNTFFAWVLQRVRTAMTPTAIRQSLFHLYCDAMRELATQGQQEQARIVLSTMPDLLPNQHILRKLCNGMLKCFFTELWEDHRRYAIKIDGAGIRLDFEFKMAKRV